MQPPATVDRLIGEHVEARRKVLKLTPQELAQRLSLTPFDILAYERGGRRFSASTLLKFAVGLECSAVVLLNDGPPDLPPPAKLRPID